MRYFQCLSILYFQKCKLNFLQINFKSIKLFIFCHWFLSLLPFQLISMNCRSHLRNTSRESSFSCFCSSCCLAVRVSIFHWVQQGAGCSPGCWQVSSVIAAPLWPNAASVKMLLGWKATKQSRSFYFFVPSTPSVSDRLRLHEMWMELLKRSRDHARLCVARAVSLVEVK